MTKLCIFCGKEFRGQKKNREHIISDWLVDEADLRKLLAADEMTAAKLANAKKAVAPADEIPF
jgi:hypothetical protein